MLDKFGVDVMRFLFVFLAFLFVTCFSSGIDSSKSRDEYQRRQEMLREAKRREGKVSTYDLACVFALASVGTYSVANLKVVLSQVKAAELSDPNPDLRKNMSPPGQIVIEFYNANYRSLSVEEAIELAGMYEEIEVRDGRTVLKDKSLSKLSLLDTIMAKLTNSDKDVTVRLAQEYSRTINEKSVSWRTEVYVNFLSQFITKRAKSVTDAVEVSKYLNGSKKMAALEIFYENHKNHLSSEEIRQLEQAMR